MKYRCLSTLADLAHKGYSPSARRLLAGGNRKFPHQLGFNRSDVIEYRLQQAEHMSMSGVQDKISLRLVDGDLVPTEKGGQYILKPTPEMDMPRFQEDVPANEHLTMQLASQVFGIPCAINACVLFHDGELAYITKRFDRIGETKLAQEDFCQLSNRTEETRGKNYKYDGSYEEVGRILKKNCRAYAIEIEKLFNLIAFNYAFSNGDAHMKNFSLLQTEYGDFVMTPAYDLLASSLHFPTESRTALDLFDTYESQSFRDNGFYTQVDFRQLAEFFSMKEARAQRYLDRYHESRDAVFDLIQRSFLSSEAKSDYRLRFDDRLHALKD